MQRNKTLKHTHTQLQILVTLVARTYPMNCLIVKYPTNFERRGWGLVVMTDFS